MTRDTDLQATAEARVRGTGQRYTASRRALVVALSRAQRPLAISDLVAGRRPAPQSSVYRNLAALERAGVVRRVITEGDFGRFELAEDLTEHHHHLVCSECGRVEDLAIPAAVERTIDRTLDVLARDSGFATVSHRLDVIGLCRECAGRGRASSRSRGRASRRVS